MPVMGDRLSKEVFQTQRAACENVVAIDILPRLPSFRPYFHASAFKEYLWRHILLCRLSANSQLALLTTTCHFKTCFTREASIRRISFAMTEILPYGYAPNRCTVIGRFLEAPVVVLCFEAFFEACQIRKKERKKQQALLVRINSKPRRSFPISIEA